MDKSMAEWYRDRWQVVAAANPVVDWAKKIIQSS
jgi:hypothetical protein